MQSTWGTKILEDAKYSYDYNAQMLAYGDLVAEGTVTLIGNLQAK